MKIAIKFKEGKAFSWKYPCLSADELKLSSKGFNLYEWAGAESDIFYLTVNSGNLVIDESAKTAAQLSHLSILRKSEIQARLTALSQDLVQALAGETVPNLIERKQEFIALHNELRAYEGKHPRETQDEIL